VHACSIAGTASIPTFRFFREPHTLEVRRNRLFSWSETNCLLGLLCAHPSAASDEAPSPPGGDSALSSEPPGLAVVSFVWSWRPLACIPNLCACDPGLIVLTQECLSGSILLTQEGIPECLSGSILLTQEGIPGSILFGLVVAFACACSGMRRRFCVAARACPVSVARACGRFRVRVLRYGSSVCLVSSHARHHARAARRRTRSLATSYDPLGAAP